jgi:tetratricopeptide (TPR) repeat protein
MDNGARVNLAPLPITSRLEGWHVFLIVLLGVVCYCNSFSVPFIFDDYDAIVDNQEAFGSRNLWNLLLHGGPRRIADFSFAVNYKIHGLQVTGYHITNLVIHLSTSVILYFLCIALLEALDLSSTRKPETSVPASSAGYFIPLAASLLFVSHPLQTQAVTYIVQRYTSLASLFYLLAVLAYVKGRINFELCGFNRKVLGWSFILVLSAFLGVYTKPIVFSFPFMLIMLELCLFNGRKLKHILIVFGALVASTFSVSFLPELFTGPISHLLMSLDHASAEDIYASRSSYFLTQLRVIITYLRLLIIPIQQRLDYDYPEFFSLLNFEVLSSLAVHSVLIVLAVMLYIRSKHKKLSTDLNHRHLMLLTCIGIAWFYIALSVESSFIPITDVIMEHRVYLPSAGFFIAISAIVQLLACRFKVIFRYQWLVLMAVCLLLTIMTIKRNHIWRDDLIFWQYEATLSPKSGRVLANLGLEYLERDNYEQALRLLVDAVRLEPNLDGAWTMIDNALHGLGRYQGRFKLNDEYLTPEGDIDYRYYNQFYSNEFNNVGLANEFIGQPQEAFKWYKKSLALNPDFDLALFNIGLLSTRLGIAGNTELAITRLKSINQGLAAKLESETKKTAYKKESIIPSSIIK